MDEDEAETARWEASKQRTKDERIIPAKGPVTFPGRLAKAHEDRRTRDEYRRLQEEAAGRQEVDIVENGLMPADMAVLGGVPRLLDSVKDMVDVLRRVADAYPWGREGQCPFCDSWQSDPHPPTCPWVAARDLIRRIDGTPT